MTTVDFYDKEQSDALLETKANSADVYTKSEADTLIGTKANSADVYTKSEADTLIGTKANSADVYTKAETNTLLGNKADDNAVAKLAANNQFTGENTFGSSLPVRINMTEKMRVSASYANYGDTPDMNMITLVSTAHSNNGRAFLSLMMGDDGSARLRLVRFKNDNTITIQDIVTMNP